MNKWYIEREWQEFYRNEFLSLQKESQSKKKDVHQLFNYIRKDSMEKSYIIRQKLKQFRLNSNNSLLHIRLLEYLGVQIPGIFANLNNGLYFQIVRELRFILESWVSAFYVDHLYPLDNLSEKIIKKENHFRGRMLFQKVFPEVDQESNRMYQKYFTLYRKLSKSVHVSADELSRFGSNDKMEVFFETMLNFDEKKFDNCLLHLSEVHLSIMLLVKKYEDAHILNEIKNWKWNGFEKLPEFPRIAVDE